MSKPKRTFITFLAGGVWTTAIGLAIAILVIEVEPTHQFTAGRLSSLLALAGAVLCVGLWLDSIPAVTAFSLGMRAGVKVGETRARVIPDKLRAHILKESGKPTAGRSRF